MKAKPGDLVEFRVRGFVSEIERGRKRPFYKVKGFDTNPGAWLAAEEFKVIRRKK